MIALSDLADPTRTLNTKHHKYLIDRGIPSGWARANCYSATSEEASNLLGYTARSACIVLKGVDWQIQVKPDKPWKAEGEDKNKKAPKYRSPLGEYDAMLPKSIAFDKAFWRDYEALKQKCLDIQGKPYIVLTEGFFKAIMGCIYAIPTIALLGVEMGLTSAKSDPQGKRYLVPTLERLAKAGFNFIIAFDADCATNENVLKAEKKLTFQLKKFGIQVLSVTGAWSPGIDGETKGMDDFIRKEGIEAFRQILLNAYERNWEDPSQEKAPSKSLLLERYEAAKAAFAGRLRWNELKMSPELDGKALDFDTIQIQLAQETGIDFPENHVRAVILQLAAEDSYDPVKVYLEQVHSTYKNELLPLETLAEELLGAGDKLYNTYLTKHLIGSVARRYKPGCQMDTMLVLKGKQGIKKSTFFRALYGNDWFDSTPADTGNGKDELLRQHTHWCNELGELDGITSKKDAARMKAELTNPKDTFRPPYGRNTKEYPRRFISVGTTNADSFLVDPTGDRRFWVIDLGSKVIDLNKVRGLRDRIWATAVSAYKAGMQWWLTDDEQEESNIANKGYAVADAWEEFILMFLSQELAKGVTYTTVSMCLADSLLKIEPSRQSRADQNRCADVLRRAGWLKGQKRLGERVLKVWFPPSGNVATPLGSYRGVATAESIDGKGIEALSENVATPLKEIFLSSVSTSGENSTLIDQEIKNIAQGVATSFESSSNPFTESNTAVATPPVATSEVATPPWKPGDKFRYVGTRSKELTAKYAGTVLTVKSYDPARGGRIEAEGTRDGFPVWNVERVTDDISF